MLRKFSIILLNILPFAIFASLYRYGANVGLCMPFPQLLITILNTIFAKSKKEFLVYNSILLISSVAGILVNSQLYFKYICYDIEGVLVMKFEIFVAIVLILIFTAIEFLIRYFHDKKSTDI